MADFDVLIKGGTVVDGLRVPRYRADIGIKDGRIAQVGGIRTSDAAKVLDASGLIVAPGFVDLHTHYDAQIQWDPWCTLSGWHGVTSVAMGNCGFGFAPVRPEGRERAMLMMSRNEAIPLKSMQAGMLWDWVTFPEWMDTLARIPKGVNCLSYVPLSPLMIWVMGIEAAKSRPATDEERREIQRLLGEGMDVGACGWSIQRLGENSQQADYDGTAMPTDVMADEDVLAMGEVVRERDEGLIQITQQTGDFSADVDGNTDYRFVEQLARVSGRPILYNIIVALDTNPEFHRNQMRWLADCNARGLPLFGQGLTHRQGVRLTLEDWNFFDTSPAWARATTGTHSEKMQKLADPELRAQMKAEEHLLLYEALGGPVAKWTVRSVGDYPELEKYRGRMAEEIAKEEGKDALDVVLDVAVGSDLTAEFQAESDLTSNDPDKVGELLRDSPYTMPGVSDGGAHTKFLVGGAYTTDTIAWLVRETQQLTLEEAHYRLSSLPAHAGGFKDRGYLREGMAADIVVYDFDNLKCVPEHDSVIVHDVPAGEWRLVQRADGYRWTLVNGEITFEDGECTGATPGALLRHGRAAS